MKSSSRLFPVRLISAEVLGNYSEDVYLLKPGNSLDPQLEIAVTHLTSTKTANSVKPPLILLHGNYQNRFFWYNRNGQGLAHALLNHFDIWLVDCRGHGASPRNPAWTSNTLTDYASFDLLAVNRFVIEQVSNNHPVDNFEDSLRDSLGDSPSDLFSDRAVAASQLPMWLGCEEGALVLLYGIASAVLTPANCQGIIGLGNPWRGCDSLRTLSRYVWRCLFSRSHQLAPRRGPETEPQSLLRQLWRERLWLRRSGGHLQQDFWETLKTAMLPISWLATAPDLQRHHRKLAGLEPELLSAGLVGASHDLIVRLNRQSESVYDLTHSADSEILADVLTQWYFAVNPAGELASHAVSTFSQASSAL